MHADILRPAPSHIRARFPNVESVRIKRSARHGTFTVWAEPPSAGPGIWLGSVRTFKALAGPIAAHRVNSSYPGPGSLDNPDSTD